MDSGLGYRTNPRFHADNVSIKFGSGGNSHLYYDGTDLVMSPAVVGTGDLKVTGASVLLDSGEKIDFGAGDVTLTHAASKVTLTGGDAHIDDGQGVVIGHSAQVSAAFGNAAELQVLGTGGADSKAAMGRWGADANGPGISFIKSRNPAIGSFTVVQDGDRLGELLFGGDDGTDYQSVAARIRASVDGSPGTGDMPGRLTFETTSDGSQDTTERMRIDSGGGVLIGETVNAKMTVGLTVNQGSNDDEIVALKSSDIGHGITNQTETDTYGVVKKSVAVAGGLKISGYTDASNGGDGKVLHLQAIAGQTPQTTDTSSSNGVIHLDPSKKLGTSNAVIAATENGVTMTDGSSTRFLLKGNGDLHVPNTTLVALDDYPDALLARVGRAEMAPAGSFLHDNFAGVLDGARSFLIDNRIMWPDEDGETPWIGVQKSVMLGWDMAFQNAGWIRDVLNVLTPEQQDRLPGKTREMLALMPAGS